MFFHARIFLYSLIFFGILEFVSIDFISSKLAFLSDKNFLFIKSDYKILRINFDDIKYIEGMSEYIRIHLTDTKPVMTLLSMKAIEEQLPADRFMRVHRSYIVNLSMISVIERSRIVFDGKVYIPVSEQYKNTFQTYIEKNILTWSYSSIKL